MKNKKGFIATTLIYSFLLLFASLVVVIIGNYSYYRSTLSTYNKGINNSLNTLIENKYVTLSNLVNNSDFEGSDSWSFSGSTSYSTEVKMNGDDSTKVRSLKFGERSTAVARSNYFNCEANHYYYFSYTLFTNGTVGPIDTGTATGSGSTPSGSIGGIAGLVGGILGGIFGGIIGGATGNLFCIIFGNCGTPNSLEDSSVSAYNNEVSAYASGAQAGAIGLYLNSNESSVFGGETLNIGFQNMVRRGFIEKAPSTSTTCNFAVNYNNNNNTKMFIDNVVVTDVTDIINKSGSTDYAKIIEIFNTVATSGNIPYFHDTYTYNMDNLKNNLN